MEVNYVQFYRFWKLMIVQEMRAQGLCVCVCMCVFFFFFKCAAICKGITISNVKAYRQYWKLIYLKTGKPDRLLLCEVSKQRIHSQNKGGWALHSQKCFHWWITVMSDCSGSIKCMDFIQCTLAEEPMKQFELSILWLFIFYSIFPLSVIVGAIEHLKYSKNECKNHRDAHWKCKYYHFIITVTNAFDKSVIFECKTV